MAFRYCVVAVGDELLAGAVADLDSPYLARVLGPEGGRAERVEIVGDRIPDIVRAVRSARDLAPLVLVTGGLGPTQDDVTREAVAEALDRETVVDPQALERVRSWFEMRGVPMPPSNERQARLPRGARILANRAGTAPGFLVEVPGGAVAALPGPPHELEVVAREQLLPWLRRAGWTSAEAPRRTFHLAGLSEGAFAEAAGPWMARDAEPRMGCTAKEGRLDVVLYAPDVHSRARELLEARAAEFRARFASWIFSETEARIEHVLGNALLDAEVSITVAESCTGGLVAGRLTEHPGISAVFQRGYVTYSNAAKRELLGVGGPLLEQHGAVSAEVAEAMARGAARASGARLALAVTGIAGPGGGTPSKPVGLVWFATVLDDRSEVVERRFPPAGRSRVRTWAAHHALFLAWRRLRGAGLIRPPSSPGRERPDP